MPRPTAEAHTVGMSGVPYGARIDELGAELGSRTAVVFLPEEGRQQIVSWEELAARSTQLARALVAEGLSLGDRLAVSLRNRPEHLIACFAGWKAGATVVPVRWDLPAWELRRLYAVLRPKVVLDSEHAELLERSRRERTDRLPPATPPRAWGICSSGSTGAPKVIMMRSPATYLEGAGGVSTVVEAYGPLPGPQVVLVPAPLYHTNGFTSLRNLMAGVQVVLLERFDAQRLLEAVERHRVTGFIAATPMLQRLARAPGFAERDLSSLQWVQQGAAPLPEWLGRLWIDRIGAEHFYLSYGSTEAIGLVVCRGDEWLEHPGTLGKPFGGTEVRILDEEGRPLRPGQVGTIYMRVPGGPGADYLGEVPPMPSTPDGFYSVGDLGYADEDGWVFLADRRVDMIVTGGANVYPAEVESALSEHPAIADVVVVGLPDPEWGRRVHAIVAPAQGRVVDPEEVIAFARSRLAAYKVPKSVEVIESIPRSEALKVNRSALVAEREGLAL